ncbi:hypothetical protein G7Z17_g8670 [Cylindrodendrum hubeiense]|uniref:Uncharacterized protein n=1 Tax=Cylindrodendrum hubeiense TaxID=595255 RepID=A0A9P5H5F7_9HYPO|nr:hypothetical protein G7Z17_g8670 [Cylindrodendrum hubeiense]
MIHLLKPSDQKLSTPVPGFTNDQFDSTSSDIHVYPDPQTLSTERPMFFVDCEGLAGAENPIARQMISSMRVGQPFEERPPTNNETPASIKQVLREETKDYINNPISKTDLRWGKTVQSPSAPTILSKESKRHVDPATRKAVVKHLYPRLLYAFSDVVCFVSNNARRSQNFLSKLIDWAKDGHERTINQQVKPALIIALNKDTEVGNAMPSRRNGFDGVAH